MHIFAVGLSLQEARMARPLRIAYENAIYHVINRGHRREPIFVDNSDRAEFLARLAVTQTRFNLVIHAYCLMHNHYHLLVGTPDANLSRAIHTLNSSYVSWFRARHGLVGSLFQGRFKSILVEKERYLVEVSAYIHLNPVRAGLVKNPEEWKWSSAGFYLGRRLPAHRKKTSLAIATDEVVGLCGGKDNYLAVMDAVRARKSDGRAIYGANSLLGEDSFVDQMKTRLREPKQNLREHMPEAKQILRNAPEDVERAVRAAVRLSPESPIVRRRGALAYKMLVWALRRHSALRLDQIGDRFGVKPSAISELVRRIEAEAASNEKMHDALDLVMAHLEVPNP